MTDKHTQTEETTEYTYPPKHPLVLQNIENMHSYNTRLVEITDNSDEYLSDFYNESPNFTFNKEFVAGCGIGEPPFSNSQSLYDLS